MKYAFVALMMAGVASSAWGQTTQPSSTAPANAATSNPTVAAPDQSTQSSADQLLNRLLQPSKSDGTVLQPSNIRSTDRTSGSGAVAPAAPSITVLREGSYLVDRTGHMTRSSDGRDMEFTFISDGRTMRDPPVIILPNLKLMAMETAAAGSTRDLLFRITGMVTEYRGRNYILLDKVVIVPDAARPLQ